MMLLVSYRFSYSHNPSWDIETKVFTGEVKSSLQSEWVVFNVACVYLEMD
jgi:hypothetical protein